MRQFRKIVVTGGAGFIGSHLVDAIRSQSADSTILIVDKLTYAANFNFISNHLSGSPTFLRLADVTNYDAMASALENTDVVFHLAAESHVDRSFRNSLEFTRSNTLGTHVLLEAARQNSVPLFVHVSTDEVYGEVIGQAPTEEGPLNPTNPYSASKAAAEMIVAGYIKSFNAPVISVRANNIFGIRQFPEKIIPAFICKGILGQRMPMHGSGEHQRHYLAAQDFAEALLLVCQKGKPGECFNVGGIEEYTNLQVAEMIAEALELDPRRWIAFEKDRPFNDRRYAVDWHRIAALGWEPRRTLKAMLPEMVKWYRKNISFFPHLL